MGAVEAGSRPSGRAVIVPPGFDPAPSLRRRVEVDRRRPRAARRRGVRLSGVHRRRRPGRRCGSTERPSATAGFDGGPGQTHVVASAGGPVRVAVGVGDRLLVDGAAIRDAGAAFGLAIEAPGAPRRNGPDDRTRRRGDGRAGPRSRASCWPAYSYDALRSTPRGSPVTSIAIVVESGDREALQRGAERGLVMAGATMLARDLANTTAQTTPPSTRLGEVAWRSGPRARARGRGLRQATRSSRWVRRPARGQRRQRRAAADDQAHLPPRRRRRRRAPCARRQGNHVRLRRHQPQAATPSTPR